MKQKLFLTSAIAMAVIAPAVAETFPSNGLMQEDKTYENAANETNMDGVYQGSVNATAQYDVIDYILSAGQYLPKDSDTQTICPAGSFCAGGSVQYDEENDQGIQSCPAEYALSAEGASSQNECYRQCTTSDVEHSATVTGEYYYGDNNQCGAASCVKGWHVNTIGQVFGTSCAYRNNAGSFTEYDASHGATYYGLTNKNTWATDYGDKGMLIGQGRCSTQSGSKGNMLNGTYPDITTFTSLTDETGQEGAQYCYCNVTGYKNASGTLQSLSAPWVFYYGMDGADRCASNCAHDCALTLQGVHPSGLAFRAAVFGSLGTLPAMCKATDYRLYAGKYLPADSETPTTCPAGSFCAGGTVQYDKDNDQGITSCPTIDDATFTSPSGSKVVTSCYQEDSAMSSAELNPFTTAHLDTSKNGNGYINGVKYKSATTTARRYATSATTAGSWAALDTSDLVITGFACENGYHYKAGTTAPNLTSLIGITERGEGYEYISNNGYYAYNEYTYGITQNGEFVVDYGDKGKIHGHAQCSTQQGFTDGTTNDNNYTDPTITTTLPDSSGQYCYCQLDSYTPVSGSATVFSSPWVFFKDGDDADSCATVCAALCAAGLRNDRPLTLAFRAAAFGSLGAPAICEANTININWTHADQTDIDANNAGTATYGEDVRTPVKAETIKGKTFLGWKFSKPEQTNLSE